MHLHSYDWVEMWDKHSSPGYLRKCECGFRPDEPAWRVLVTASRNHRLPAIIYDALAEQLAFAKRRFMPMVVIHGAAPGGDSIAHEWAMANHWVTPDPHPANWKIGKVAGSIRNQFMVDLGADICLGFPLPGSIGTWDCLRRADDAGIPTKVLEP